MTDKSIEKTVLTLDVAINSAVPSLKVSGYSFLRRVLQSKPENWKKIASTIETLNPETDFVVGKFTEYTIFLASLPTYTSVLDSLVKYLKKIDHMIYIYEANLSGIFSCEVNPADYYSAREEMDDYKEVFKEIVATSQDKSDQNPTVDEWTILRDPERQRVTHLQKWCRRYDIEDIADVLERMKAVVNTLANELTIAPYRVLTDVELGTVAFVDAHVKGLVLRVYVPSERIWRSEVEKIVRLFQEYASSIRGLDVQLVQEHTEVGTIYSLYSKDNVVKISDISALFDEFTSFLEICANNPEKAAGLIKEAPISPEKALRVITKYIKEAKRLSLDIRHEAETKLLNIRHQFESELLDTSIVDSLTNELSEKLLNNLTPVKALSVAPSISTQNITINNQYIQTVNGIISSQIYGRIDYNNNDEKLLELIGSHSKSQQDKIQLESALAELKDQRVSAEVRTTAWQKLRSFLAFAADKAGDVGVAFLVKYLESYFKTDG